LTKPDYTSRQASKQEANAAYKEVMMALLQEKEKGINQENFQALKSIHGSMRS
jgi:hypothetical protein